MRWGLLLWVWGEEVRSPLWVWGEEVVESLTRVLGVVGVEPSALALWVEWMAV